MFSALPLRRDNAECGRHVRKVPIRDSCTAANQHLYSITSSARVRRVGGTMMRSAFAVFKLITSSNLVGFSNRQVARLRTLENLVDEDGGPTIKISNIGPLRHKEPPLPRLSPDKHGL